MRAIRNLQAHVCYVYSLVVVAFDRAQDWLLDVVGSSPIYARWIPDLEAFDAVVDT